MAKNNKYTKKKIKNGLFNVTFEKSNPDEVLKAQELASKEKRLQKEKEHQLKESEKEALRLAKEESKKQRAIEIEKSKEEIKVLKEQEIIKKAELQKIKDEEYQKQLEVDKKTKEELAYQKELDIQKRRQEKLEALNEKQRKRLEAIEEKKQAKIDELNKKEQAQKEEQDRKERLEKAKIKAKLLEIEKEKKRRADLEIKKQERDKEFVDEKAIRLKRIEEERAIRREIKDSSKFSNDTEYAYNDIVTKVRKEGIFEKYAAFISGLGDDRLRNKELKEEFQKLKEMSAFEGITIDEYFKRYPEKVSKTKFEKFQEFLQAEEEYAEKKSGKVKLSKEEKAIIKARKDREKQRDQQIKARKKALKKQGRKAELIKHYNVKNLAFEIKQYGFSYNPKDFLIQAGAIIAVAFGIGFFSLLKAPYILLIILATMATTPFLVMAWFNQLYVTKRFAMVSDYLSNIIPIFMQKAKIRYTLSEVSHLTSGLMRQKVLEAIDYIDNNTTDVNGLETALGIIEDEFPNSRLKSVHKMMLSVEEESTISYHDICENMYIDVENWIKRTFAFQKDLVSRRNQLLLLCGLTLMMNMMFIFLYTSNAYFAGMEDNILYQISTTVFILAIVLVAVMAIVKLHGGWLINDMTSKSETRIANYYDKIQMGRPQAKKADQMAGIIAIIAGVIIFIFYSNMIMAAVVAIIGIFLLTKHNAGYSTANKEVSKALTVEFPIWLREVSLSLGDSTVLNAIENSMATASYPMRKELEKFMLIAKEDPTSIRPFVMFLEEFDLSEAQSTMRVLYSIQNLNRKDTKEQVAALILRNQELLDKAEAIKNKESISGVEALGFAPMLIFSVQMLFSLVVLFGHMMGKMGEAMSQGGLQ